MFITAELIKLICEKTWVQCQFQWNIGALRSLGKLSLRTDAQILNWLLVVQNSRAKENHKMTLICLRNLSQGTKKVKKNKKKTLNQIICWVFFISRIFWKSPGLRSQSPGFSGLFFKTSRFACDGGWKVCSNIFI